MKVVVLGAGMLASRLGRTIWPHDVDVVVVGHDRFDIRDQDSLVALFREEQPSVVVNTVALHNLAACEQNSAWAFDVNARGAERVASLVPTVYISTDYVFADGGPHEEGMPGRQPRSVYGRSKLAGELATLEHDGIVVRVSGLYDPDFTSHKGLSFPESIAQKYGAQKYPSDQIFSPTYAPDAAERIAYLAEALVTGGKPSGIYHAANAGSVSWADFAVNINEVLGRPRVSKITPFVARDPIRPTNSALKSTRLPPLRHWLPALAEWVTRRQEALYATRTVSPMREVA